ncbi:endonuclease domain-containing protein [Paenarthrobacter sp. NPDC058040]|uniref:endonuclease domain-containing protein n=2 Tax=unclassified Paenarthrobacter TaxID=2634190 RepID=UPI0036DB18C6
MQDIENEGGLCKVTASNGGEDQLDFANEGKQMLEGGVRQKPFDDGVRARNCNGPGRNGQQICGKPTDTKTSELCSSHRLQQKKNGTLKPLRTRTEKSTCIGPGQVISPCGRKVYFRPAGRDDGVCKTHHEQMQRRGFMTPIELRLPPLTSTCTGPGIVSGTVCGRPSEARDSLLCSPHDRQLKKNGDLKPIRRVNTPDGPCTGPGPGETLCGRPITNKGLGLCSGHYAQHHKGKDLTPLKVVRKRGDVASCLFPGCRYNDAPGGEGYCHHHWRQNKNGHPLTPLQGSSHRGRSVLRRDENGNKLCIGCVEWKPENGFSKASAATDGLNYICRQCHSSKRRNRVYGIGLDEYEALLFAQNGHCRLCPHTPNAEMPLVVDHNHKCCPGPASCGHCIRGLLCQRCNQGLGLLQENAEILLLAAAYVLLNDSALTLLS